MSATSRRTSECLSDRELSDCVGPGTFIPPHVIECADCRRRRAQLVADAAVLRGYAVESPSAEALAAMRAHILRGTHRPEQRERPPLARWAVAAAVLLALGGAAAAWWVTREAEAPPRWARIEDGDEARYQHEVVRLGDHGVVDEIVRLERGRIRIRVDHLSASQRFRVLALDGDEVEVRGTTFDVAVDDGRLSMVSVLEGLVAVRRVGQPVVWLESGDTWRGERGARAGTKTSSGARAASEPPLDRAEPAADATTTAEPPSETGATPGGHTHHRPRDPTRGPSGGTTSGAAASDELGARRAPSASSPDDVPSTAATAARAPEADVDAPGVAETSSKAAAAPPVVATPPPTPDAGTVTPDIPARLASPPPPEPEPSRVTVDLEAAEAQFGWGWDALREREYVTAARYFGKAELLAGADPLAEDAAYWRAMALHDAQHPALDRALEAYVVRYPSAPRWATVALLRAERLIADGRPAEARPLLTRVAQDPDYIRSRRAKELLAELR